VRGAIPQRRRRSPSEISPDYFLDWAFDEMPSASPFPKSYVERVLVVRTTIDMGAAGRRSRR
jgi:hypothetical protein